MNPRQSVNPNYNNSPHQNQLWSDAMRLPAHSNTPFETHTYVPQTNYVRPNIPPAWDDVLTRNYNYGNLPSNPRYNLIESQSGQDAWSDNFFVPSAEHGFIYSPPTDQLVTANRTDELNSYDFEAPRYNRVIRSNQQPVQQSRVARVIDDEIMVGDIENLIPSVPVTTVGSYDFDEPQYNYQPQPRYVPRGNQRVVIRHQPTQQPDTDSVQLELDLNNPQGTNEPLPNTARDYVARLIPLERFQLGIRTGNDYAVNNDGKGVSRSVLFDRTPQSKYGHLDSIGNAGFIAGRIGADIYGSGTRHYLWNAHPNDFTTTEGRKLIRESGGSRMAQLAIPYLATVGLGIGSNNYDPFNIEEGGRPQGYAAINPGDDPRQSTSPFYDMVVERGMFGRRGRLLPWEQFSQERPDISFDQYDKYQQYLYNKDENILREMTGGLVKGTMEGIDGPEINVMGYSVNPVGAAAALGIITLGRKAKLF